MKVFGAIVAGIAVVALAWFAFVMVDVDQTQSAALPDVDVSVEGGQLPEFDAEVGSIAVGETQMEVEVPEVEVTTNTEILNVPTLEVTTPEEEAEVAENN